MSKAPKTLPLPSEFFHFSKNLKDSVAYYILFEIRIAGPIKTYQSKLIFAQKSILPNILDNVGLDNILDIWLRPHYFSGQQQLTYPLNLLIS